MLGLFFNCDACTSLFGSPYFPCYLPEVAVFEAADVVATAVVDVAAAPAVCRVAVVPLEAPEVSAEGSATYFPLLPDVYDIV